MLNKEERAKLQEIFNVGYLGVIKQGEPSFEELPATCKYRDSKGHKCAVGFSIPDETYSLKMEGTIYYLLSTYPLIFGIPFSSEAIMQLREFQTCHDFSRGDGSTNEAFIERFKKRCARFAEEHNYTLPEISDAEIN